MRWRWPLIVTGVVLFLTFTCYSLDGPPYYYADPIRATVVDFETHRPVPGAVVAAIWWVNPDIEGGRRFFHLYETKTDANGVFLIPGWGPQLRPACFRFTYYDPDIHIYRPGYMQGGGDNKDAYLHERNFSYASHRTSIWNGKEFELRPAHTIQEQVQALESIGYLEEDATAGLHLIWAAWQEGYLSLPPSVRASVSRPSPVIILNNRNQ